MTLIVSGYLRDKTHSNILGTLNITRILQRQSSFDHHDGMKDLKREKIFFKVAFVIVSHLEP